MSDTEPQNQLVPSTGSRPIWILLGALAVTMLFGSIVLVVARDASPTRSHKTFEYTVPPGTTARIEAGEQLFVFPGRLVVHVGDQLVIHNNDTTVVEVGPYTVDRNATLAQNFNSPGTIVGICTIHPSGKVTIQIRA